jgi:hypothetical protein
MAFQANASGTNWQVHKNGTSEGLTTGIATPNSTTINGYTLGRQINPARHGNFTYAEMIVVQSTDAATRQLIEGYLAWKWGLTYALPANHPYRWDTSLFGGTNLNGFDTDAKTYIASVETADVQELELGVKTAINDFIVGAKADGIWDAIKSSAILAGARTLNGALVPLKGTAPTNFNFVTGDYNRKTGLVGDGSTKYLNSNRAGNAEPVGSHHLTAYVSTHSISNRNYIGDRQIDASTGLSFISYAASTTSYTANSRAGGDITTNVGGVAGFVGMSRSTSSVVAFRAASATTLYSRSASVASTNTTKVFASGNLGSYATCRLSFYSIGESLDLALLDTRVTQLITDYANAIP